MGPAEKDDEGEPWVKVVKASKLIKSTAPYYISLSNAYTYLEEFSADSEPTHKVSNDKKCTKISAAKQPSKFKARAVARIETRHEQHILDMKEEGLIDMYIDKAEDERSSLAKMIPHNKTHSDKKKHHTIISREECRTRAHSRHSSKTIDTTIT